MENLFRAKHGSNQIDANGRVLAFVAVARLTQNIIKRLKLKYMNTFSQITRGNEANTLLPAVSFQFLYRKKPNQEFSQEFVSKKKTIIEAMDDFLTRKKNLCDINEKIEVTYQDGNQEMIQVDARQDWDMSWYFVHENNMICGNGYACHYNGR